MQFFINILVAFFFILLYLYFFLSFFFEKKSVFVIFLLSFITFYDFVFIHLSPFLSPAVFYFIKSWQEYLLLFLALLTMLSVAKKRFVLTAFDRKFLSAIMLVTVAGAVAGMIKGIAVSQVFLGWRMYVLPLVWSFFLYKTAVLKKISSRVLINFFLVLALVVVAVAAYQEVHFRNDLKSSLWFYDFIDKLNPIDEHEFDFVRDEQLRATGVFVSPLIYTTFLSFAMLLLFFRLYLNRTTANVVTSCIIMAVMLYGQFLSRTRIGFIILAIGFCCSMLAYKRPSSKFYLSLSIPLFFLTATFVSLIVGATDDPSALGRLIQYASLPSNFVLLGMGFGAEMTNVYFDSFYISIILLFGAFVPIYIRIYFILLKKVKGLTYPMRYSETDPANQVLFYAAYGFLFSFVYTFGFHFIISSATIQLFYVLLFTCIAKFDKVSGVLPKKQISYEPVG